MPPKRRGRQKKGLEETVNSLLFEYDKPNAASSPASISCNDSLQSVVLEALNQNLDEYRKNLDERLLEFKTELMRSIKLASFEHCLKKTGILEYWTLEGLRKAKDEKQSTQLEADQQKQRIPLASAHLIQISDALDDMKLTKDKKRRSKSVPPPKKTQVQTCPDDDSNVFLKPSSAVGNMRTSKRKRTPSSDGFITPMSKPQLRRNIATVTPGPDIHKPLAVMRRPNPGEMAISLSGSPLLVSSDAAASEMAYINLPVDSKKVLSIFPRRGFTRDDVPLVCQETKQQLKLLNEYLNAVCNDFDCN